jgi:hypothetical protein
MNGVANSAHDVGDHLEDVLAFEWVEKYLGHALVLVARFYSGRQRSGANTSLLDPS